MSEKRELTEVEKKFIQSIREGRHKEINDLLKKAASFEMQAQQLSEKYHIPFEYGSGGYCPQSGKGLDERLILWGGGNYEEDFEDIPEELLSAIDELGYVSGPYKDYGTAWCGEWMPSRNY